MGKTAVPQANPGRDETVGSGTEKRRAVEVLTLPALPSPEVLSVMQDEDDMPEKAARRGS